jgi:hypothetical protein
MKTTFRECKGKQLLNENKSFHIALAGLVLSAFAFLAAIMFGFGGFSIQALVSNKITGFVSRIQMFFLILAGVGFALSGFTYQCQAKKRKIERANLILLAYLLVSLLFFVAGAYGFTAHLRGSDFWGETTFEEIRNILFFNNLTLILFFVLGTLQLILSLIFFKTKILRRRRLSKFAKILTLTSGIFMLAKAIIDYPPIKEVIFVLSYSLKLPLLNNIVSIIAPLAYLSAQFSIVIILLNHTKTPV